MVSEKLQVCEKTAHVLCILVHVDKLMHHPVSGTISFVLINTALNKILVEMNDFCESN